MSERPTSVRFEFDARKAIACLVYLASKPESIPELDKYKAGKLLFLANKYHLVRFGRPIFGDEYRALQHGPIPQGLIDLLSAVINSSPPPARWQEAQELADLLEVDRKYQYPRLRAKNAPVIEDLSQSDLDALDHIINIHGKKSFDELKALTHEMPAYHRAWKSRGITQAAEMRYEDFFEEDADAIAGAKDEMLEEHLLKALG